MSPTRLAGFLLTQRSVDLNALFFNILSTAFNAYYERMSGIIGRKYLSFIPSEAAAKV